MRHHPIARHPEDRGRPLARSERAIARYADEPWYTALSDDARRAHDEWFAGLSRESRDALHQDSALHAALARLDPDTRRLLTNCESPCFDPELDAQTLEELQRVVRRLRISPSHTGLRRYLSRAKQEGDTVTAVARLRDVRRPSDLDAILRASAEELVARAAPEIDASIAQLRPTNAELAAEIERSDLLREILYGAGLDTTDLERLWRNFQNRRSRLAPAHQTFEAYVGHLYGDSLHNPRLATRFPELFGTRASRLERHLAILETVEPNLADLIRGGDAGEFTALLTRLRRELARADFVGGATRLRLPRSRVRRFVLSFLASEVRSIDELRRVSGLLRRPEAVGALGEYYAALRLRDPGTFQSTDVAGRLDEDVRLRQRSFEPRPGLPLTGGGVRPDRVLPLPGGGEFALDIKFGYGARDVELGQARNFATLERVGEVRGSGYLFLPRGTRSARDAARRQLVFLRREGVDPLPGFST
ncbi:MAG: hypothetical protein M5U28_19330 [Sandaracinaceae bacterium]|nr:hypothetical protein [Sandaracinaceae bacterium]